MSTGSLAGIGSAAGGFAGGLNNGMRLADMMHQNQGGAAIGAMFNKMPQGGIGGMRSRVQIRTAPLLRQ